MSGKSTAQPCMNLENLGTSVRHPERIRSSTHAGGSSPGSSASLISSTACGKRVSSVRCTGISGSLNHRFEALHVAPSRGFSDSMHRLVSSEHRTDASYGTWNAVRMYTVRNVGCSCFASAAACTSENKTRMPSSSEEDIFFEPSAFFLACDAMSRFFSISQVCLPCRNGTTSSAGSANRSFTDSSPVHDSRCVLRSTNTGPSSGSRPYQRSRMAILCGCFLSLLWYKPRLTLSRYTELVICESAATPGPLATAEGSADGRVPSPETTFRVFWRSIRNTGRCSASVCFTVLTSSVATQYLRVERTKFCAPGPPFGPLPCAALGALLGAFGRSFSNKSDICTTKTALWSAVTHGELCRRSM